MKTITPHLWLDTEARQAAEYYVSVFPNSKITSVSGLKGTPSGNVEVLSFELNGQPFVAISAGPLFKFNESISFILPCETQEEIDYYWEKLSRDPNAGQCGWCKDKFGLSWQIVPAALQKFMASGDPLKTKRVTEAFLKMKKFDVAALEKAFEGK